MKGEQERLQEAKKRWASASALLQNRWRKSIDEALQSYSFHSVLESAGLFSDAVCGWLEIRDREILFSAEIAEAERDLYAALLLCVAYKSPREHVLSSMLHFERLNSLLLQNLSILMLQICPKEIQDHLLDLLIKMIDIEEDICQMHSLDIEPFEVCVYPVTQSVYEMVMDENPSTFYGFAHPVDSVSWLDCIAFCNALSERNGFEPVYKVYEHGIVWLKDCNGYRLLSELEWQICAESGSDMVFSGASNWEDGVHCNQSQEKSGTRNVIWGQSNAWGLKDCSGNVFEWCWDRFQPDLPLVMYGPNQGETRVRRGGAWNSDPRACMTNYRSERRPEYISDNTGFRIARTL